MHSEFPFNAPCWWIELGGSISFELVQDPSTWATSSA